MGQTGKDQASAPQRFVELDGLRGVAALVVAIEHAASMAGFGGLPFYPAVDLFFLISGFVIPFAYEARLLGRGMSLGRFLEARAIRLYPLYIAGVLITFGTEAIGAVHHGLWLLKGSLYHLAWAIPMLPEPHWEAEHSFPLNPAAYTLFLELVINVAYAAFIPRLATRTIAIMAALASLALLVSIAHFGTFNFGTGGIQMIWGLSRVASPFLIGVVGFRLWSRRPASARGWTPLPALIFLACPLLYREPFLVVGSFITIVALLPVAAAMAVASRPRGLVRSGYHWLGELSYPLYCLHLPLFNLGTHLAPPLGLTKAQAVWIALPGSILVAFGAIFADRFVRDVLSRRLKAGWAPGLARAI